MIARLVKLHSVRQVPCQNVKMRLFCKIMSASVASRGLPAIETPLSTPQAQNFQDIFQIDHLTKHQQSGAMI
jgi:2-keto-3-deoxy-6-phosphogluconate aldolase